MLLSSHILAEVETLADRLSIIRDGVIVATGGTLSDLRGRTRTSVRAELETIPSEDRLGELHEVDIDGQWISATVDSDRIGAAMEVLTSCGLRSLTVEPPSLESLFLRLYGSEDSKSGKK